VDPFQLAFDPESTSQVARSVAPYVIAAAKSLGRRLWSQTEVAVADEAADWGRRLARQLRGHDEAQRGMAVLEAVDDVIADLENEDAHAALRLKIGKVLAGSPQLLTEVIELLKQAQQASASNQRSAVGTVSGISVVGDRSVGSAGGWAITGDHNRIGSEVLS
jgi:hypothetical protein